MTPSAPIRYKHRYFSASGKPISFKKQLMQSGEATLWQGAEPDQIAKIYHEPSLEKTKKLQKMIKNPPQDPTAQQGHLSIVWPQELVYDEQGAVVGFLMQKIKKANTLSYVYNSKLRRKFAQGFNWYYLHTACMNLAWILKALHEKSYVIGDIKTENFLVNPHALVSILDTDSFQIGEYACPVGSEGFTPPELIDQDFLNIERQACHDMFGIAVIFYLMLFGYHPFSGAWKGKGLMPSRDFLVKQGQWMYAPETSVKPGPHALSLDIVHPRLKHLFHQTFTEGHKDPRKRPTPQEWIHAFQEALGSLEMCDKQAGHFYYHHAKAKCPWCHMDNTLGFDPYPTPKDFSKDNFLVQKRFEKADKKGDDRELLKLWQNPSSKIYLQKDENKFLRVQKASNHQRFLEKFQQTFVNKSQGDEELLSLWGKCKSFAGSLFSKEEKPGLGGKTAQAIMRQVTQRQKDLQAILKACSQTPIDFIEVHNIWKSIEQKSHPIFTEFMSTIEPILQINRSYQTLLKVVNNNEIEKIAGLWDEEKFAGQIQKEGLQEKIQKALMLGAEKNQSFSSLSLSVFKTQTLLHIKWQWGKTAEKSQGAYIAVDFDRYPQAPEDVEMPSLAHLITKKQYLQNKGAWVQFLPEYKGKNPYISIWPAQQHCGKFVLAGLPLHINPEERQKIYCLAQYATSKWKETILRLIRRHYLTLRLSSSKTIVLPEMDVVAAFGHPPVAHGQGTLFIGRLPRVTIKANEERIFTYTLPKWFNHEFEIALLPKDKKQQLNTEIYYEVA